MKIAGVAEMRELDREAIDRCGIDELLLMENAGAAAARVVARELGDLKGKEILLVCGGGNNGGDGFVLARHLLSAGARPRVFIVADPAQYRAAAARNLDIIEKLSPDIHRFETLGQVLPFLADCDAVVDALLGTGLSGIVREPGAALIDAINGSGKTIISLDIPSGINGDTGAVMGTAIQASCTVTFGLPKTGNLLYPGCSFNGRLYLSYITVPPSLYDRESIMTALNVPPPLPARNPGGHKGDFGEVLVIAGAGSYYGAPLLSALSFLKAGGGYARLAAPASMIPSLASAGGHEIVFLAQAETDSGSIALSNADALVSLSETMDFVVLGPGLSLDEETGGLVRELAERMEPPLLIDGDGITALARDLPILKRRKGPTVLTPHMGEMARLTGMPVQEIAADRIAVLRSTASDLGAVIVLKGSHSLVGYPDGRVLVNVSGNSGMATAGSGDVLTGAIAAMFTLGLSLEDAVAKGVFLHGCAGDVAAGACGEDGMTARDILNGLPRALMFERRGFPREFSRRYRAVTMI